MRILAFNNEFPPLGGGTGVVNLNYFKVWANNPDVTVDLVTSSRSRSDYEVEAFSDNITLHKVPVDNRNIHHASNLELLRYVKRGMAYAKRELLPKHDYTFCLAFHGVPAGAMAMRVKKQFGLPYIVKLEGADIPGWEARYAWLYPFLKPIIRRVWRNAWKVVSLSEDQCALAKSFMPDIDFPIIFNGVDTEVFSPPGAPRAGEPIKLLNVGRLIERKGQHHLLRAFKQMKNPGGREVTLTLVGAGDAEKDLKQLCAELDLEDRVQFTGAVDVKDMPGIYRAADVFILASQSESMPLGLLEAMAAGLPSVVTDTGGTAELIDGNGRMAPWADVDALAEALDALVADDEGRIAMGRKAREMALQFSWKNVANEYLEMGRQIAESSRA